MIGQNVKCVAGKVRLFPKPGYLPNTTPLWRHFLAFNPFLFLELIPVEIGRLDSHGDIPGIESGDPYRQIVPPAMDAGPESASFSFSPSTCSASALVTSLHASSSLGLLAAGLARVAPEAQKGQECNKVRAGSAWNQFRLLLQRLFIAVLNTRMSLNEVNHWARHPQ